MCCLRQEVETSAGLVRGAATARNRNVCEREAVGLYLREARFESRPGHQASLQFWFSSVPPCKWWDSTSYRSLPYPSMTFPIHQSTCKILHHCIVPVLRATLQEPPRSDLERMFVLRTSLLPQCWFLKCVIDVLENIHLVLTPYLKSNKELNIF
jgi:hypothetical protein